jgi:hypothetical protein
MALDQTHTDEYITYVQTLRTPTTDYLLRKSQTDRTRLSNLLNRLLQDREVVIMTHDSVVVATQKTSVPAAPLPSIPKVVDRVADQEFAGVAHVAVYIMPRGEPALIELDTIRLFITRREGVDGLESL